MERIRVRPMQKTDYAGVREVNELTQRQYRGDDWDRLSGEEKELNLVSRASEFELNLKTGYCYVATRGENVIGFILAHETLPFRGTLYTRHIAIHPDLQGRGIGQRLYAAVIEKAKQSGIRQITAVINADNPHSMKLHEQVGFGLKDIKEAVLRLG